MFLFPFSDDNPTKNKLGNAKNISNTISSRMGTLLKCGLSIGVKKIAKNPDRIQFNIAKIS